MLAGMKDSEHADPGANTVGDPRYYLALHRGIPGDVDLYHARCGTTKNAILELGCGDGRILAGLMDLDAKANPMGTRQALGIDIDPAMVAHAKARQENRRDGGTPTFDVLEGDICDLGQALAGWTSVPNRQFDRIIFPFSGLFCLDADQKRACLEGVLAHLTPGGAFLFDVYDAEVLAESADDIDTEPDIDDEALAATLHIPELGQHEVWESNIWWPSESRLKTQYRFLPLGPDGTNADTCAHELSITHHYCLPEDLVTLMTEVGFVDIGLEVLQLTDENLDDPPRGPRSAVFPSHAPGQISLDPRQSPGDV